MTRIGVIITSTRQARFAERPAAWVTARLRREGVEVDVIDMRDHDLPSFDGPPPLYTPRVYATPEIAAFAERIDAADGFVILTAEYNHGYTAVFKNAVDHTSLEWDRKPMSYVGWGGVGGARAIEQLRTVAVELGAAPLRNAVHILPDILVPAMKAPSYDPALLAPLDGKLNELVSELLWWTEALRAGRHQITAGAA